MGNQKITDEEILSRANRYISDESEDAFREEIRKLCARQAQGDRAALAELRERFDSDLSFGTGGLRGIIGGGSNRLNPLAVRRTTQGLARYLKRAATGELSVVIAHDSRRYSGQFAREAALVLAANGIRALLFDRLQPTPVLSFMVRQRRASAGIVITASHNPPEYNGYKVYWNDGAQIIGETDEGISDEIKRVEGSIAIMDEVEAIQRGLFEQLDEASIDPYYEMAAGRMLRRGAPDLRRSDFGIVYTPLHGTGLVPVTRLFDRLRYRYVVVPEQSPPDGNFTFAPVPNPEDPSAFRLAFTLAAKTHAGLILATDPDADRLGVAVPDNGGYHIFSGNDLGVLILDYLVETMVELNTLPATSYIVKTIVTSELQRRIAESRGVLCLDTLTGFKHICAVMRDREHKDPGRRFLLGNEESCGYLIETEVRDKDGVSAAALVAEMALYYHSQNKTLIDRLHAIQERHGLFLDFQVSHVFPGSGGMAIIERLMTALRREPAALSPGSPVRFLKDYRARTTTDGLSGEVRQNIDLPPSDVLQMALADGSLLTARPSGTEPKIKFYASLSVDPPFERTQAEAEVKARGDAIRKRIRQFIERNSA
jgi:phosphoglucomutase